MQTCDWPRNVGCPENSAPNKDLDDDPLLESSLSEFPQSVMRILFINFQKDRVSQQQQQQQQKQQQRVRALFCRLLREKRIILLVYTLSLLIIIINSERKR
uniref:Uncharacterized protein n=1 Tax=Trichogramma kaykai TaxID=54128 RepID=A0ABD2XBR2_9HYME